jgi:hypothetical protein
MLGFRACLSELPGEKMRLLGLSLGGKNSMAFERSRRKNFSLKALNVVCIENNFISSELGKRACHALSAGIS